MKRPHFCQTILFVLPSILLIACSAGPKPEVADKSDDTQARLETKMRELNKERALRHFIEGSVYDAKGDYAKAILEYQDALRYDANPAIYYAISKDYSLLGKHALAAQAAREAVRLDSTNITYRENLARIYLAAFQTDLAIREYEQIVRLDTTSTDALYQLARLYQTSRPLKALEIYEKLLEKEGEDWDILLQTAELYNTLGRYDQAADRYKRMLEMDPSNRALQRQLAETYGRSGNFAAAIEILEKMLETNENDLEVVVSLADIYLDKRDFDKALELYEKILKKEKDNPDVKLRVGVAYFGQIQQDSSFLPRSKKIFNELSKQSPNDWRPIWYLGAIALSEKQDSVALQHFERVTQLAESNADAWSYVGMLYFDRGEYNKMIEAMEKARKVLPREHRVYFLLGLGYSRLEDNEKATMFLEKAYELNPKDINTLSTLALTYDGMKRFSRSDSLYEEALKIDSTYHLILNNFSYSLAERGLQLERALRMAIDAVKAEPKNASYLDTLGWVYFKLGRYREAEEYIAKAVATGEASAVVYEHLGDIYFKLGEKEKAVEYWQKALEKDGKNQALREKVERGSL
ncbi:MAG TPA: tetratricopeptide repeat protein [Bacteroidota bacterium]|nr:tetratricopeptide repeat protein [Bacteroidota bacterium]